MIPQGDLLLNPKKIYNKFKELIDIYRENIETKDKFYYKYLLEEFRKTIFWNIYVSSDKICMHVYKKGRNAGEICGAKIFIETNNRLQRYLCSRHCRDYETKQRYYDDIRIRCSYIRSNYEQCKHRCKDNNKFCYIHKTNDKEDMEEDILKDKKIFINKLKIKRKLYFKLKKLKNKKQNLFLQNFKEKEKVKNYKTYKNYKEYIKYINYNFLYSLFDIT